MDGTDKCTGGATDHAHTNFFHRNLPLRLTEGMSGLILLFFVMVIQGREKQLWENRFSMRQIRR